MTSVADNLEFPASSGGEIVTSKSGLATYRSLFGLLRSFPISWPSGFLIALLLLSDVVSQLSSPILTHLLVDGMSAGQPVGHLIASLTAVMFAGSICGGFLYYVVARKGSRWVLQIRRDISEKLLLAPIRFFKDRKSSEPASHLIKDSSLIQALISQQTIGVISGLIVVVGCIIVMGTLDIVLTLVLLGIVLSAFLVTLPVAAGLTSLSQRLQKQEAENIASMGELLAQIELVKSHSAEDGLVEKQQKQVQNLYGFELKEIKIQSLLAPIAGVAISAGMIAILAFGSYRVSIGAISIGKLLAFILYLFNIVIPLASFSMFVGSLNKAAGAADQLAAFMAAPQEPMDKGQTIALAGVDIECFGLEFWFGNNLILENIDLVFPAGKMTALVGESGAGKTTLLNLLDRLHRVQDGQLSVNGVCVNSISLRHWRAQIALVSQSAPVISGSLRENLTLGLRQNVKDDQLLELITEFGLEDLSLDENNVLDGDLKENGKNLSGGQKQRIAIARAILRKPELLLLDEATSALDALTERKVTTALAKLSNNTTTVVAAHRLSTVVKAEQIVVMKHGKVVDTGTHENLLACCPYYQELVHQQMLPSL